MAKDFLKAEKPTRLGAKWSIQQLHQAKNYSNVYETIKQDYQGHNQINFLLAVISSSMIEDDNDFSCLFRIFFGYYV